MSEGRKHKVRLLLYCHDVDRGIQIDEKAYSPILDCVREHLEDKGADCISVAHPYSRITGRMAANSPKSVNFLYFAFRVANKLFIRFQFGIKFVEIFYILMLKVLNRNLVIAISPPSELCAACKYCGIPVVEFSHGYSHTTVPKHFIGEEKNNLPDYFIVYSLESFNEFKKSSSVVPKVILSEHPGQDIYLFESNRFDVEYVELLDRSSDSKFDRRILVTFCWGYDGDLPEYDGILDNGLIYDDFFKIISEYNNIFWFLRLHPVQLRDKSAIYARQKGFLENFSSRLLNCEWKVSSRIPIGLLAKKSDLHVSMASGACYDLANFGVQSLMLCPSLRAGGFQSSYFEDLVKEGYVVKSVFDDSHVRMNILKRHRIAPRKPPIGALSINDLSEWLISLTVERESCFAN